MTAEETAVFETANIVTPSMELADDAFAAIRRGDVVRLRALLDNGLDVDTRDDQGLTLLMHAVRENQTEAGQELLIREADPFARSDAGMTALMLAATGGNVEMAKILLEEIEDNDLDNANDEVAEELALQHGNMAVFAQIQERKRRAHFNEKALDEKEGRDAKEKKFDIALEGKETTGENAFQHFFHGAGTIVHNAGHFISNCAHGCANAWSRFIHHKKPDAAGADEQTAEPGVMTPEALSVMQKATSLITNLLHLTPKQ